MHMPEAAAAGAGRGNAPWQFEHWIVCPQRLGGTSTAAWHWGQLHFRVWRGTIKAAEQSVQKTVIPAPTSSTSRCLPQTEHVKCMEIIFTPEDMFILWPASREGNRKLCAHRPAPPQAYCPTVAHSRSGVWRRAPTPAGAGSRFARLLPGKKSGGENRDRTDDTRIFSPLLYQLSYLATQSVPRV